MPSPANALHMVCSQLSFLCRLYRLYIDLVYQFDLRLELRFQSLPGMGHTQGKCFAFLLAVRLGSRYLDLFEQPPRRLQRKLGFGLLQTRGPRVNHAEVTGCGLRSFSVQRAPTRDRGGKLL